MIEEEESEDLATMQILLVAFLLDNLSVVSRLEESFSCSLSTTGAAAALLSFDAFGFTDIPGREGIVEAADKSSSIPMVSDILRYYYFRLSYRRYVAEMKRKN
mmetsp:Transcript_314/g.836  ORF Transcript_314/g.836 Transcript_314/m.836 type:complete len:103 (+) Transcript_314:1147-1455(+)